MQPFVGEKRRNPDELVLVAFQECSALRTGLLLYPMMWVLYCIEMCVPSVFHDTSCDAHLLARLVRFMVTWFVSILVYVSIWGSLIWWVALSVASNLVGCSLWFGIDCGTGIWWDMRSTIARPFKEVGLFHLKTNRTTGTGSLMDDGLMMLSNQKPEEPMRSVSFVASRGTEILACKGIQYAYFNVSGQRYLVVHTHLQDPSDCCGRLDAYESQVTQLIEAVRALQSPRTRTILMGGLDCDEDLNRIRRELGLVTAAERPSTAGDALDQVLLSVEVEQGFGTSIEEEDMYSDHPILQYHWKQRFFSHE